MATQYTNILKLALPTTGELDGTWGDVVNNNITSMIEEAIAGLSTINTWSSDSHTLTTANGTTSESRAAILVLTDTGTSLTGAGEVICPSETKVYIVANSTGQQITVKTSAGSGVALSDGQKEVLYCDGTDFFKAGFNGGFDDGTAASPSIFFTDQTSTGFYRVSSGVTAYSAAGTFRGVEFGGSYNYLNKQTVGGVNEYTRFSTVLPRLEFNIAGPLTNYGVQLFYNSGSLAGSISITNLTTSYVTSSDYRLKENIVPIESAVARIDDLNPVRFNFIGFPDRVVDGFLAHEVSPVVPEAITGEKDAVDEEGNPIYQGIDQAKLVPLLVAAVQELSARVTALEAK
jgi:hypothetical protein